MEMRTSNTEKVNNFIASLPPNLSEKNKNSRKLQFMAENGIRQLGLPRIGHFADKLRPEPMHCEINAWQHYIDLLYLEAVRIKKFDPFVSALEEAQTIQRLALSKIGEYLRNAGGFLI